MQIVIFSASFYAVAAVGFLPQYIIALPLLYGLSLGLAYRPALLVIICSVQDAPNYSHETSYIIFLIVVFLTAIQTLLSVEGRENLHHTWKYIPHAKQLFLAFIFVTAYAAALSYFQDTYGLRPQSELRDYRLLAVLMFANYLGAFLCVCHAVRTKAALSHMAAALVCACGHALAIASLQIPYGQEIYRSGSMLEKSLASGQLNTETAIGIARLNGPFLSPNALGLYVALLLILFIAVNQLRGRFGNNSRRWYTGVASASIAMSMSKALLLHQAIAILLLVRDKLSGVVFYLVSLFLLAAIALVFYIFPHQEIEVTLSVAGDVLRLDSDRGLGTRGFAWTAVFEELTIYDWLTGVGLSHWPILFLNKIGIPLADPHTFIISIAGGFGLVGVVFYIYIVRLMIKSYSASKYVFILMLLIMILVKDLASIQSVLGNSSATFLLSFGIFLATASYQRVIPPHNRRHARRRR